MATRCNRPGAEPRGAARRRAAVVAWLCGLLALLSGGWPLGSVAAELGAQAQATVAQALYAASATLAAAERAADARLLEQRRQIAALQARLKAPAAPDRELQRQLQQAQDRKSVV